ncbi:MAG: Uma2 family endonuclease [Cyanobacteria bacterium Co-bin13]|nr:Uma2 family endonuclease [Cyanobacteria bacterium Co-bin13]
MPQALPQPWDYIEPALIPPTEIDSNEPPLESDWHRDQINLLIRLLQWYWRDQTDFYVSGNLTIYFNERQLTTRDFRGPDFFVVLGAENRKRRSWVLWAEDGKYPNVLVELLSPSTAAVDKGLKKQLYQDVFRTPEYFLYNPDTQTLEGFHLVDNRYEGIVPTNQGWLWSQQLELFLGLYEDNLRFFTAEGSLVLLPEEEERQRAEAAEQALAALQAKLKAQGINLDDL